MKAQNNPALALVYTLRSFIVIWQPIRDGEKAQTRPGRFMLIGPLCFAAGAALWFAAPDMERWRALAGLVLPFSLAAMIAIVWRLPRRRWTVMICVLAALAGGARAMHRSHAVAAPILPDSVRAREMTGWIEAIERSNGRERLLLRVERMDGMETPPVRVRIRAGSGLAEPGDRVALRAVLGPPPRAAVPGAYDFAFNAWFRRIGGTGYAISPVERLAPDQADRASKALARLRWRLAERIRSQMPEREGGLASALLTGDRSGVTPETAEALRSAGLGHILAISGLHMALFAGGVFVAVRAAFAAWPAFARRHDARAPAALAGLIAGAAIPTQRAFIMSAVVFVGWMAGRRALSLNGLGLAMLIVLILRPESVVMAGFQMSFAATGALIAAYEMHRRRRREQPDIEPGAARRFFFGLSLTSLVAGAATAGFGAFHFHRLASFGFFANLLAMPVFSILVMPAGLLAMALTPLGLEAPALWVMGRGLMLIEIIAGFTADLPGALAPVQAAPGWVLALYATGFACACIAIGRWRLIGAGLSVLALSLWPAGGGPDLFISETGVALARFDGRDWSVSETRRERFAARVFLERVGIRSAPPPAPLSCDATGCTARLEGLTLVWLDRLDSLDEDCRRADIVLTRLRLPHWRRSACRAMVLDAGDGERLGGVSMRIDQGRVTAMNFVSDRHRRAPWSRARPAAQ